MAFPVGWQRICPLVIQQSRVMASALVNFPVLLTAACLPNEMVTTGGANAAQSNGGDIRFSSDAAGLNQLACEIVSFVQNASPASATAEIWVSVPSMNCYLNTTIYVWYEPTSVQTQPAANAAFGSQAVWDSFYKYVWHGGDGTTLGLSSSATVNANTLTNNGSVTAAAGKIGGAASFGGANYLSKTSPTGLPNSGPITLECWMRLTDDTVVRYAVASSVFGGTAPSIESIAVNITPHADHVYAFLNSSAVFSAGTISVNAWAHLCHVYTTPSFAEYINGAIDNSTGVSAYTFGAAEVFIGALDGPSAFWKGQVDEVRISSTARSSAWISTQYNNHNSPTTFTIPGTPYAPGAYVAGGGYYRAGQF